MCRKVSQLLKLLKVQVVKESFTILEQSNMLLSWWSFVLWHVVDKDLYLYQSMGLYDMVGAKVKKPCIALCTSGIRHHKKCRPMSARHNFIVQIT